MPIQPKTIADSLMDPFVKLVEGGDVAAMQAWMDQNGLTDRYSKFTDPDLNITPEDRKQVIMETFHHAYHEWISDQLAAIKQHTYDAIFPRAKYKRVMRMYFAEEIAGG